MRDGPCPPRLAAAAKASALLAAAAAAAALLLARNDASVPPSPSAGPPPLRRLSLGEAEDRGVAAAVAADAAAAAAAAPPLRDRGEGGEDSRVMIVSAFYGGGPSKYGDASKSLATYAEWMRNCVKIDAPYYVFGQDETLPLVREARAGCDWCGASSLDRYERLGWDDFISVRALRRLGYDPLKDVRIPERIWSEKVALLSRAAAVMSEYGWFAWVDIGVNIYRADPPPARPWPAAGALRRLPRSKVIVTFKGRRGGACGDRRMMMANELVACITGTFMVHREALPLLTKLYYAALEDCVKNHDGPPSHWHLACLDDQVILTKIMLEHPEHFYSVGNYWAGVVSDLYEPQGTGYDLDGIKFMTNAKSAQ